MISQLKCGLPGFSVCLVQLLHLNRYLPEFPGGSSLPAIYLAASLPVYLKNQLGGTLWPHFSEADSEVPPVRDIFISLHPV